MSNQKINSPLVLDLIEKKTKMRYSKSFEFKTC